MKAARWIACWSVLGCSDALPSPARLDRLRVLALETDTPDVRPGAAVRVRAAWFDPTEESVSWHWRVCDDASDDPRRCAEAARGVDLLGDATVEIAGDHFALPTGATTADVIVYALVCGGSTAQVDARSGRWSCAGSTGVEAFRRVTVRAVGALNLPPAVASWSARVGATDAALGATTVLRAPACDRNCATWTVSLVPADGAAESIDGATAESLMASFAVSDGDMDPPRDVAAPGEVRAMTARWTPSRVPSAGEVTLATVLRDQRGGETVRMARVRLEAE